MKSISRTMLSALVAMSAKPMWRMTAPILVRAIVPFRTVTVPAPPAFRNPCSITSPASRTTLARNKNAWTFRAGRTLLVSPATIMIEISCANFLAGLSKMMDTPPRMLAVFAVVATMLARKILLHQLRYRQLLNPVTN